MAGIDLGGTQMEKSNSRWEIWAGVLSGCAILLACVGICMVTGVLEAVLPLFQSGPAVQVGEAAPDFTLPTLAHGTVQLSGYAGQPVLLSFGATW
jgi:hypothetical protein